MCSDEAKFMMHNWSLCLPSLFLLYPPPQLKEDFIHDSLYPPVSVNNAIWMVAADMAKEAIEKNREFNEFR